MKILAIDPGTKCGWCLMSSSSISTGIISGVWDLRGGRYEGGGMRFLRLKNFLKKFESDGVEVLVYEEVRRHLGTDSAHIYGGIVAVIQSFCEEHYIPYEGIPVGTIKKHATGKGNANKGEMIQAAKDKWPGYPFADDNEVDARFIADYYYGIQE